MTDLSNSERQRFKDAIVRFDTANTADPNTEIFNGKEYPKELLYSQRMSDWLDKYQPNASEALHLAARAQHICRWKIPRSEYPLGRIGYNKWRSTLAKMHGDLATEIMRKVGYDEAMCEQVKVLLMKDRMLLGNRDGKTLEDVICLVFLEFYFVVFASKCSKQKLPVIVRKTWRKMSDHAHQTALTIAPQWPADLLEIVKKEIFQEGHLP